MTYGTRHVRVERMTLEAAGICSLELVDPDGRALPGFSAGAHIDVYLPNGIARQYSLCNDPRETHRYQIAVLRDPASRGGSAAMHDLAEGQTLRISDPRNHFPLAPDAARHLLLAGGIGVTPILCMAEQLASIGAPFQMHYCARSRERAAFVERIDVSAFARQVLFHFDDGSAAQKLDLKRLLDWTAKDCHLYVCGPAGFMDWVLGTARDSGWPEERLHWEYFAAVPVERSDDGPFEVQIHSTQAVIPVAADQTVVAALAASGIEIPVSCEQGICGTCLTGVLDGEPLHRDMFLTAEERIKGDQFTPCCSRARSRRLILDL